MKAKEYRDPTQTLPDVPQEPTDCDCNTCESCENTANWSRGIQDRRSGWYASMCQIDTHIGPRQPKLVQKVVIILNYQSHVDCTIITIIIAIIK
jgi:hypothetical protein